jgi:hypothetical protein
MSKIVKSPDAPEGDVRISYASTSFVLSDESPSYETDDFVVLEQAALEPLLSIEVDAPETPKAEEEALEVAANEPVVQPTAEGQPQEVLVEAPVQQAAPAQNVGAVTVETSEPVTETVAGSTENTTTNQPSAGFLKRGK